jgi:hypothetical protein
MDILEKAKEFEKDFIQAMQTLHVLAAKHALPEPEIVFSPEWKAPIRCMSIMRWPDDTWLRQLSKFFGISVRFGRFETGGISLREM